MSSASLHDRGPDFKELERELRKLRHESLIATRRGDFRKVAQLTSEAARLSKRLAEEQPEPPANPVAWS